MFSSPILLRSIVLTMMFIFSSAIAFSQTIYVDAGTGDDSDDGLSLATAKATIQAGITTALSGATVIVAAGTYAENITINKALTLQGPNVGVAGNGTRGAEAIIEPASQGNAIQITEDNVTIEGLQVGVGNVDAAIYQTDQTDIIIQNNVINADSVGIALVGTGVLAGSINVNSNLITLADFVTTNTSSLATGVALIGLSGTVDVDLSDNVYSGGAHAIFVFGCLSTDVLNISDEIVTDAIRGISVFSYNGVARASSTIAVSGLSVTDFDEPISGITDFPQAGLYFYTDGSSTDSHIITATVNNSTFSGTSNTESDYAGIICGDFSSADYVASLQDITINESTFSDNENRGIQIRGQNTNVSITGSTFQNNGFDPIGTGGNHGFHVVVRNDAIATIANSIFINPASQTNDQFDGLSLQAGGSLTITNSFFNQNGNGTLAGTTGINLSSNYFSSIVESTILTLVGAGNDFTPWIASSTDTDMGTAGFQPDLDSLYVGTSGTQTGSTGRIDEAISLVNASGAVIVESGTYSETVTVDKAVNLLGANVGIPSSSPRVAESIIEPSAPFDVGITVNANNVEVNGLQIGSGPSSSNVSNGIVIDGQSELTVQNNMVYANSAGIIVQNLTSGSSTISDNAVGMLDLEDGVTATLPSVGIQLLSISGDANVSVNKNNISNASFGIGGFALTPTSAVTIDGGLISECTQGIAVNNTNGAGGYSPSNINIQNVTMNAFQNPGINVVAPDAEAGIYLGTFSGGSDQDTIVAIINNVDISGVSAVGTDYSGIYVADFIDGGAPFNDVDEVALTVTINESNIHDNSNRGVFSRGANSVTTINRSTLNSNVNGAVLGSEETEIFINNSFIQLPSGTIQARGLVTQSDASMTASQNSLDINGNSNVNTNLASEDGASDLLDLSNNWFGTTDLIIIEGYFADETEIDFTPWIGSGTDTNPSFAGFQPDLSTLHVGTSGDQDPGGIIQEGHNLVDTLGTVIVNGNSYGTDTLEVLKDITLIPLVSLTMQELTTNGGTVIVDNDLTVNSTITLTNGVIDMDEDDGNKVDDPVLTITGATINGSFSDANHIEGKVSSDIAGASSVEFPVGDNGTYRPVTITPVSASTFEVAHYVEAAPTGGGSNDPELNDLVGDVSTAFSPAVIQSALTTRYWNIDRTSGTGNTDVGLQVLDSDMEVEPGTLSIAKLNSSGDWEEITRIGESGTDPYVVTGQTADFSSFSLVSAFGMSPGNVSGNLQMWLKAGQGVTGTTSITQWDDFSGNNFDVTPVSTNPAIATADINFNDAIDFTDDPMRTAVNGILAADNAYSKFVVFKYDASAENNLLSTNTNGAAFSGNNTNTDIELSHDGTPVLSATSVITSDEYSLGTGIYQDGSDNYIRVNGTQEATNTTTQSYSDVEIEIGGLGGADGLQGSIAEVILYNTALNGTDLQQVESYLAMKYGITLPNGYLASDGGTVWNVATNSGYNNDIAGIGRDDFSGLDQRKSKSIGDSSLVAIALGNFDTPSSFADNDAWLIWGNDGADSTFTASIDNAHTGTSNRMQRVWRVQETGAVGTIELSLEATASEETVSLIVHPSDDAFPNDANRQVYEMVYSSTTNDYRVTVDMTNGDYFTFAEGPVGGIPAVLISEVITDPQLDWSDDEFHNPDPGTADVGTEDEWIELFITENNLDLTNWTIELIDGASADGGLEAGDVFAVSNYSSLTGGLFQATDSGDFVILGDPDNVLANTQHVILRNDAGEVVDQVIIEGVSRGTGFEGNSSGAEDESVTRLFPGTDTNYDSTDFVLTRATLGRTSTLTGIVLINEIVTDPQTDWGTNNFDGSDGGGGTTPVDEWIELYIATDDLDLNNWVMDIENGANDIIQQDLSAGGAFTISNYFSETGGTFTKTDSGDYLVLGNAAENLINSPEITLYDPFGNIIDQVVLGGGGSNAPNGNADEFDNEAIARYPNAADTDTDNIDFIQTRPTLGGTNSPTGTVLINEVVTDPFQDWSSSGFDGIIGAGGSVNAGTDEWIELFIASDSINLTGWTIELVDGTDVVGDLTATGAFGITNYISNTPGSSFNGTASGDYLIIGDVTGGSQMSNDVLIILKDSYGTTIDQVQLGGGTGEAPNGANSSIAEESVARIPNGIDIDVDDIDFAKAEATLGAENFVNPLPSPGYGLDFDGADEYINIPSSSVTDNLTNYTFSAWVYLDAAVNYNPLFFKQSGSASDIEIYIRSTDYVVLHNRNNGGSTSGSSAAVTPIPGVWQHIAVTFDGTTSNFYINGVLEESSAMNLPETNSYDVNLGRVTTFGPDYFEGMMDEVRIWSDARTHEEILENMFTTLKGNEDNLVAYYNFDQTTGSSLPDLVGTNDGDLTNMENADWVTADWPTFVSNQAIVNPSTGSDVTSGASEALTISEGGFLNSDGDFVLIGHDNSDYSVVTSNLPSTTLLTNRYARSWHLIKNDVANTAGDSVTFSFDIEVEPDSSLTYYLLERSGTSGDFAITPIIGYQPGTSSVDLTVDVDSLTNDSYYTLGWSDSGPGNAIEFDGTDDYVDLSDHVSSLDFDAPATIEFWYDPLDAFDRSSEIVTLFSIGDNSTREFSLFYGSSTNFLTNETLSVFHLDGSSTTCGYENGSFNNEPHHWAIVATGSTYLIYLDGVKVTTTYALGSDGDYGDNISATVARIGNRAANGNAYLSGELDEFRIWNDERTQEEIISNMHTNLSGNETSLVAYYRMNQGIGDENYSLPDLSGNRNVGTLTDFDNLGSTATTSNYVASDHSTLLDIAYIVNTDADILTNASDELTISSTDASGFFLDDTDDQVIWGHDGGAFSEVTTDLTASTNLVARMEKIWQVSKNDVIGTADGLLTFSFDLSTAPDPDYTYYLLQRASTSGDFTITEVVGSSPNANSVEFTVDAGEIPDGYYFTLGRSAAGPGHALGFDGANDHISVSDNADLDITGELTLESWVSLNTLPPDANEGIVAKYLGAGDQRSYSLEVNTSGNVVFNISDDGTDVTSLTSATVLATDQMTQVSAVYDPGNSMSIYINGVLDATSSTSIPASIFTSTADLWIGATTEINADSLLNSVIDEVRIWDDVRTADEINDNIYRSLDVANESNLVAYYKFDDGIAAGTNTSADSLADYSGNDHVGVLTNLSLAGSASNWLLSEVPLADELVVDALDGPGNALSFDGDNDHVIIDDADELDITGAITLEAWVNLTTTPSADNEGIVSKYLAAGNEQSYSLEINTSGNAQLAISANGSNRAEVVGSMIVPTGEWTHIVGAFEPSGRMAIYVNGILDNEITSDIPTTIYSGSADVWIGATEVINADNALEASIDEVRIWNVARTTVEIQDNMFKELAGDESGLVAYYVFDELDATTTTTLPDLAGTNDGTLTNMADPLNNWVSAASREPFKNLQIASWNAVSTWKSSAVPDAITAVSDVNQDVTLASPVDVDFLNINSGVTLTLDADITVNGNLINNGTITGDGTLILVGSTPRIYGGTVGNLQLSSADVTLKSNATITGELDLSSNSTLDIDDYDLTINTITGFGETAYIETKDFNESAGFVIKSLAMADGDFTFPIGSSGSYTPLTVKNLGTTGNIQARVFDDTYAQGTSGVIIDTEKEVNKSWEIIGDAGVNVTITLQWNSENEDPNYASARSTAYLSKNNYDWWRKVTPDVGVTGSDPYQITASGIQTFSVFGTGTEDSSLPVTWMAFEAFENEDQEVELHWSTASELNNDRFEIEKSFDGRTFHVIGQIVGNGTTNSLSDYQFIDTEPFNGINYYRLRQVDYDGTDDYSELVSVFVDVQREYNITLSPNPTFDVTTLSIEWESDDDYAVGIFDMMGRKLGVVHSKFSKLNLDLSTLPKGMYIIKIHTGDRVVARKLIKH